MLAAMPQAPSKYHPVTARERVTERRNYVLREMWQNGHLDEATYLAEKEKPLKSVQNGDYPSFREALPPRGYFTDEIRRQLSAKLGDEELFTGGLTIRATVDPDLQAVAARALSVPWSEPRAEHRAASAIRRTARCRSCRGRVPCKRTCSRTSSTRRARSTSSRSHAARRRDRPNP